MQFNELNRMKFHYVYWIWLRNYCNQYRKKIIS